MSRRGRPKHPDILTPREAEVLDLLREACSNEQIAERLGISVSGVKYHVSEILSKLHLENRTDAARWRSEERPWWARAVAPVAFAWRKIGVVSVKASSVALVLSGAIVVAALAGLGLIAFLLFRDGGGMAETQAARTATPGKIVSPADQEPTVSQEREYVFGAQSSWLAGANEGWLGGSRCEENAGAAFSDRAEDSTPARPVCTGLIYHTTDGGSTWREQYRGDVLPEKIRFDGPERGMAIDMHGGDCVHKACPIAVLSTEDGGEHWAQTYTTVPLQHAELTFVGGEVWIVGAGCLEGLSDEAQRYECETYLLKSNDGGHTWSQSSLPILGSPHIARPTATDAWIATSTGGPGAAQIIATHDGGETWEALSHPAPRSAWEASMFFSNAERGWLLTGGQPGAGAQMKEVFATDDGGATWARLSVTSPPGTATPDEGDPGLMGYVGQIVFSTDQDGWIAMGRWGLQRSSDGGRNWSLAVPQGDVGFHEVQFASPDHGWALNSYSNTLVMTADGGSSWLDIPLPTVETH